MSLGKPSAEDPRRAAPRSVGDGKDGYRVRGPPVGQAGPSQASPDADKPGLRRDSKSPTPFSAWLVLALVPLAWGTYAPSVKYLYTLGPGREPPGLVFNLASYIVSALALWAAQAASAGRPPGHPGDKKGEQGLQGGLEQGQTQTQAQAQESGDKRLLGLAGLDLDNSAKAGLELGGWLFLGSTIQVAGLQLTTASRAAFAVQLTTLIVPQLEAALGQRVLGPRIWAACALATAGLTLVSLGDSLPRLDSLLAGDWTWPALASDTAGAGSGMVVGDLLVALAALFYSLHVVRLAVYAAKVDALPLARAKAWGELAYATGATLLAGLLGGQGPALLGYLRVLCSDTEALAVFCAVAVWNGAVTTAFTMWAQSRGQAVVAPSEANLVYSTQPVWSTMFAVAFLKESISTTEAVGGLVVLAAVASAATWTGVGNDNDTTWTGGGDDNDTTWTGIGDDNDTAWAGGDDNDTPWTGGGDDNDSNTPHTGTGNCRKHAHYSPPEAASGTDDCGGGGGGGSSASSAAAPPRAVAVEEAGPGAAAPGLQAGFAKPEVAAADTKELGGGQTG